MRLTDYLQPDCVKVPLESGGKKEAICELVDLLCDRARIDARDELKAAVLQREATRTTGIGRGVAIPHGKSSELSSVVMAVAKPSNPIDFGSIDGKPVDLVMLLVSPADQTGPHIQALASISRMLTDDGLRAGLKKAESADEVYNLIVEYEAAAAD